MGLSWGFGVRVLVVASRSFTSPLCCYVKATQQQNIRRARNEKEREAHKMQQQAKRVSQNF